MDEFLDYNWNTKMLFLLSLNIYFIFGFNVEMMRTSKNDSFQQNERKYEEQRLCFLENERSALYLSMVESMPKG